MAYDNMLYQATITQGGTANLTCIYGSGTIRSATYGTAKLKRVQAWASSTVSTDTPKITVTYKNTNWIRGNKMKAALWTAPTAHANKTLNSVDDDTDLLVNSSFTVSAVDGGTITGTCTIYVLFTIDYAGVAGYDPDQKKGTLVTFEATQAASFTTVANVAYRLGSYDLLDPGINYLLNEISTTANVGMCFMILEGLAGQAGLTRLIPLISDGSVIVPTLQGSVLIQKQSFTLGLISSTALTNVTVPINLEMLAGKNSIGA